MNYDEINEPQMPFPVLYNSFKREIVGVIQHYIQKGIPYCCISESMNDFARQCAESSSIELNDFNARYNKALEEYANYIREQEHQETKEEYSQLSFDDFPTEQEGVSADGQIE